MSRADRLLKSLQSRKKVGTKVHYKDAQNCEACADKFNDLYVTDTHVEICKKCWQHNVDMGDLPPLKESMDEAGLFFDSMGIPSKQAITVGNLRGTTSPQVGIALNQKVILALNWAEARKLADALVEMADLAEHG